MAVGSGKPDLPFLVLGPAGSGLSTALDCFADFGYLTLANVDPQQVHNTIAPLLKGDKPIAFSLDLGPAQDPAATVQAVESLRQNLPDLKVLTLDAPEETLVQRYTASGKPHAYEKDSLKNAVTASKSAFSQLKRFKDYSIDTSTTTSDELRLKIAKVLGRPAEHKDFTIYITTFGFKYGAPQDAELMFDMRFVTNPFYDENLRPMTGQDKPVQEYIFSHDHAREFFDVWSKLIGDTLPHYQDQGKTRLSIAVGCTGGKHRSVCMAESLALYLGNRFPGYRIVMNHREMLRWHDGAEKPASASCPQGESA